MAESKDKTGIKGLAKSAKGAKPGKTGAAPFKSVPRSNQESSGSDHMYEQRSDRRDRLREQMGHPWQGNQGYSYPHPQPTPHMSWPPPAGQYPVDAFQGPHSPNDAAWQQYREAQRRYAQQIVAQQRRRGVNPGADLLNAATGEAALPASGGSQFHNNYSSRNGLAENYYVMTPEQRRRDEAASAGRNQYLQAFGIQPATFTDGMNGFAAMDSARAGVPSQMMTPEESDFRRRVIDSMQSHQRYQTDENLASPNPHIQREFVIDRRNRR